MDFVSRNHRMRVSASALLAVGLLCSCGQPLSKGAYRVATTELTIE